jgi:prepilin-type processing-associated H-X9-DG protein
MKMFNRIAIGAALLAPMVAAPASAQSWKWDLGLGAGYTMFTNSVDDEGITVGTAEGLKFDKGIRPYARLGVWFTPRIGLRANATYQDGHVETSDGAEVAENINMWSGTGDLLFRFATPNDTWMGSEFLPYLALGLGGKWINPATDDQTCTGGEEDFSCAYMSGTGTALGEKSQLSGLVGLGADWRLSPRFAINLELNDRMYKPPFFEAAVPTVPGTVAIASDDRVSKLTHEFGADVGLKFLFGLAAPPVVVVEPRPVPPPPPPPPAPVPPATPREEAITVCVIDPTAPNGIRMQSATFLPASGDTMVMVNGNRVAIGTTVGNVMVARNADWYVRGEPLTITVGNQKMQYMTYQGATQIDADRLSYLGTVNGYPVYANRDEVADINQALADLRAAQAGRDLGEILAQRKDLRDELDDVSLLYVPLAPTGCVFQTVQMMQQVRKGK